VARIAAQGLSAAAVYSKPEFVSTQADRAEFFAQPTRPDTRAYRDYRHYLLETSQVAGGFYSSRGRRELLRQVVDMMLRRRIPMMRSPRATRHRGNSCAW
jgi:capsular polysaccharide export protein